MTNDKTGGQAFPTDGAYSGYVKGMTLRDYLAAKALAGFLATQDGYDRGYLAAAEESYKYADAMLKAREPKKDSE